MDEVDPDVTEPHVFLALLWFHHCSSDICEGPDVLMFNSTTDIMLSPPVIFFLCCCWFCMFQEALLVFYLMCFDLDYTLLLQYSSLFGWASSFLTSIVCLRVYFMNGFQLCCSCFVCSEDLCFLFWSFISSQCRWLWTYVHLCQNISARVFACMREIVCVCLRLWMCVLVWTIECVCAFEPLRNLKCLFFLLYFSWKLLR